MSLKIRTTVGLLLICVMVTAAGCEPLRKKFVRQKKKDKTQKEFIPVLDPIDYPAKIESPADSYRHYFSLWQVWEKDLVMRIEEKASDKKINFTFVQVAAQLIELEKLLTGEKKAQMNQFIVQFNGLQGELAQPAAIRNDGSIQKKMQRVGSKLRKDFRFQDVEQNLIQ